MAAVDVTEINGMTRLLRLPRRDMTPKTDAISGWCPLSRVSLTVFCYICNSPNHSDQFGYIFPLTRISVRYI
jgi:hypothetical protein